MHFQGGIVKLYCTMIKEISLVTEKAFWLEIEKLKREKNKHFIFTMAWSLKLLLKVLIRWDQMMISYPTLKINAFFLPYLISSHILHFQSCRNSKKGCHMQTKSYFWIICDVWLAGVQNVLFVQNRCFLDINLSNEVHMVYFWNQDKGGVFPV